MDKKELEKGESAKEAVGCKAWRRERLAALCAQAAESDAVGGLPRRGSARRMAERLGVAPTALSNMVHGAKNIGDESARGIEARLGLDPGWLDAPPLCVPCANQAELDALGAALAAMRA